jgi:uncharacterized membrane protein
MNGYLYCNNTHLQEFKTDTLDDGRYVIYIPFGPLVNIGQTHIVDKENVKVLDMSLKDATDIITKIGFKAHDIYKKNY